MPSVAGRRINKKIVTPAVLLFPKRQPWRVWTLAGMGKVAAHNFTGPRAKNLIFFSIKF